MQTSKLLVGTSGFVYKDWANGAFYPKGLPQSQWLNFYSSRFKTVEINVTFYRQVSEKSYAQWNEHTLDDFKFTLKGSRFISHIQRLVTSEEILNNFFSPASALEYKLRTILWQLPANFAENETNLSSFCHLLKKNSLAKNLDHAFEFRHRSWFNERVYKILNDYNFALVVSHSRVWPVVIKTTADYAYFRFHGSELYMADYSDEELNYWAQILTNYLAEGKTVYAYFNNDALAYGAKNAQDLVQKIEQFLPTSAAASAAPAAREASAAGARGRR